MEQFTPYLPEILITVFTGISSFFIGRKTQKNQEVSGELANLETLRDLEKKMVADMEQHTDTLLENTRELKEIIEKQNKIIENQSKIILAYKNKYGDLKEE